MAALLETRDLRRSFGAVVAAADVNIAVNDEEVVGVIGANGAGKTTLVNIITGYLKPTSGSIRYRGRDITGLRPFEIVRLGICRSFQIPQLFMGLSVLDNLMIALGVVASWRRGVLRPLSTPPRLVAASKILERYGIDAYRERKAGMLPQGVRKLLDIAMATVGDPRLVLLDEPTSGISVDEKFAVMDVLMNALRARAVTVLFIEHDMEIVERYAVRTVAFYGGRVIADGATANVLADHDVRRHVVGAEPHRRHGAVGAS